MTAEIAQVRYVDADFLFDFTNGTLLQCLSSFYKSGQGAKDTGLEVRAASQQQLMATPDQDHHRRRNAWVGAQATLVTVHGEVFVVQSCLVSASTAVLVVKLPVNELRRSSGHRKRLGACYTKHLAQWHELGVEVLGR